MKSIVIYYSRTGNNRYIAKKAQKDLNCDIEELKPMVKGIFLQAMATFTRLAPGIKKLSINISDYDRVILVAPVWMGSIIYPVYSFLKRYRNDIKELHYITCCGSNDEDKDGKFGYVAVFNKYRSILGDKCKSCTPFPVSLSLPEDKRDIDDEVMAAKLTDESFAGKLEDRYLTLVSELR